MKGENTIDLDTMKELFLDLPNTENNHAKRDLLEQVLKQGGFSNDEIFSILLSTYRGMDEISEEQKELNNENFQYLLNKGILSVEMDEESIKKNGTGRKNNIGDGNGTSSTSDIDSQTRFPLFDRFDCLFALDKMTIVNKKGPALVFNLKTSRKTIIETLGTIKDEVLQNDLTNHRTFIMDTETFERYKDVFTSCLNGLEVIQYKKLIAWFDESKELLHMEECKHTKNWKENVKRKVGISDEQEEKANNPQLSIIKYKDVISK